jgi:hypothetical protein
VQKAHLLVCATVVLPQLLPLQLGTLARLAAGSLDQLTLSTDDDGSGTDAWAQGGRLAMEEFMGTAEVAYKSVEVPDAVIDILTGGMPRCMRPCGMAMLYSILCCWAA